MTRSRGESDPASSASQTLCFHVRPLYLSLDKGKVPDMKTFVALWNEEAGFVVSAELVLIATIVVLSLVVGLSEVSNGLNNELEDVACAFGSLNQSYVVSGLAGHKGRIVGSYFADAADLCDSKDIVCTNLPVREGD